MALPDWLTARDTWDPDVGLWRRRGGGHTPASRHLDSCHPLPQAASALFVAAMAGALDQLPVADILAAIRAGQVTDGSELHGCIRWYAEEPAPHDSNAAFFIAESLVPLWILWRDQLPTGQDEALRAILRDLREWFRHNESPEHFRYLNKCLGDLVCGWLLDETIGEAGADPHLAGIMAQAAEYWTTQGWGWGEHLSDGYSHVALDELALLLLLAQKLPPELRATYEGLQAGLLAIDDVFGRGPRVPHIRSYAFEGPAVHVPYREKVTPLDLGAMRGVANQPPIRQLAAQLSWHDQAPPPAPARDEAEFPVHGGGCARARITPDLRLGTLSHFPVMEGIEHQEWGLAWQSYPVALWHPAGDWGFLQWEATVGDRVRAHPANCSRDSQPANALVPGLRPPPVGRTASLQEGGDALVLRVMPLLEADRVVDRLRVIDATAEVTAVGDRALVLRWPERELGVAVTPLTPAAGPERNENGRDGWDWSLVTASPRGIVAAVWGFRLGGAIEASPQLEPHGDAWRLLWEWPGRTWDVRLRLSPRPLIEEAHDEGA